jgi:peptidyl-prolyl cis-trans isomerase B (cyclophilin B)
MTFVLGAAALAAMLVVGRMHAQTAAPAQAKPAAPAPGAGPVIVVDTSKGTFEFETYPKEAPKTVEHIVALVKRNFYNGQVFHRVVADFVVQWGDPQTRDATLKGKWGTGGSGKPIGAAEMSPLHTHKYGAVAMAHSGSPALADSQMYIVIRQSGTAQLDGGYTVFGQVVSGMDVVMKIAQGDMVKRMSVKGETAPAK